MRLFSFLAVSKRRGAGLKVDHSRAPVSQYLGDLGWYDQAQVQDEAAHQTVRHLARIDVIAASFEGPRLRGSRGEKWDVQHLDVYSQ